MRKLKKRKKPGRNNRYTSVPALSQMRRTNARLPNRARTRDRCIVRGDRATVVDVAVCYDNRADRLRSRYRDKLRKYEVLKETLRQQLDVPHVEVDAVVVGSRGLLLPETSMRPLERLGIGGARFVRRLQEGAVRGSVMVWRAFTY